MVVVLVTGKIKIKNDDDDATIVLKNGFRLLLGFFVIVEIRYRATVAITNYNERKNVFILRQVKVKRVTPHLICCFYCCFVAIKK